MTQTTEVEYHCPNCQKNFVVYHRDEDRNDACAWCGSPVTQTGKVSTIEGEEIVVRMGGLEVARRGLAR